MSKCELCGEQMPDGEEMFKYHGYSGDCPKPPLPREPSTLRVCIAIDQWKLPIFTQVLSQSGIAYEQGDGLTPDTFHLYVETQDLRTLEKVVRNANDLAAKESK